MPVRRISNRYLVRQRAESTSEGEANSDGPEARDNEVINKDDESEGGDSEDGGGEGENEMDGVSEGGSSDIDSDMEYNWS